MVLNSTILMRGDIWQDEKNVLEFKSSTLVTLAIILLAISIFTIVLRLTIVKSRDINGYVIMLNLLAIGFALYSFNAWRDAKGIVNKEVIHPVSLTEIKDFIEVKDDKMIIEPVNRLPHNSRYFLRSGAKDENRRPIFKIEEDQFYESMSLVSQYGEKFELGDDEIQMIRSKRR